LCFRSISSKSFDYSHFNRKAISYDFFVLVYCTELWAERVLLENAAHKDSASGKKGSGARVTVDTIAKMMGKPKSLAVLVPEAAAPAAESCVLPGNGCCRVSSFVVVGARCCC
jgi:hypothetical protein